MENVELQKYNHTRADSSSANYQLFYLDATADVLVSGSLSHIYGGKIIVVELYRPEKVQKKRLI